MGQLGPCGAGPEKPENILERRLSSTRAVHPMLTALDGGDALESRPIVVSSILVTACLASSFSSTIHSVMIPQPSGFEMSSTLVLEK